MREKRKRGRTGKKGSKDYKQYPCNHHILFLHIIETYQFDLK
jgi:hypothetical protein